MEDEVVSAPPSRTSFVTRLASQWHRYRKFLLKYWWIPVLTFAVSFGIQYKLGKRIHLQYASVGRMIVNYKISIPTANVWSEEFNNFFGTQVALMQSDKVINRVTLRLLQTQPNLHVTPVEIAVALTPKTSIFNLRAVGGNPEYTEAYLKATMEEYISLKRDLLSAASTSTQTSMQEELKRLGAELAASKSNLLAYQSTNSAVLQQGEGNSAAEYLALLQRRVADQKSELQMLTNLNLDENLERQQAIFSTGGNKQILPAKNGTTTQPTGGDKRGNNVQKNGNANGEEAANEVLTPLGGFELDYLKTKQQVILLKAKEEELSKILKPRHPDMVALNDEIARQQKLLSIYQEQSKEQLKNRQHTLQTQIADLESQIKDYEKKAMEVSKKLVDVGVLKENQKRAQAAYDTLQANLQTVDMNKDFNQESVTILEAATPAVLIPPDNRKRLIMAALIGVILGIGILAFMIQMDDRPISLMELEEHFDLPLLGQFPDLKTKNKKEVVPILQPNDERYPVVEAYRSLRSALLFRDSSTKRPASIVVTSASPNDGKSMISANFAVTLAQSGAKVLLIDADLRRGVVHEHFEVPQSPGLAEVLGGWEWEKAVKETKYSNLSVMPCGSAPRNPGHLFAAVEKLMAEAAEKFEFLIFDTAPVMVADDVLSLAPHADGLIMVIRSGFTSTRVAQAALDLLIQRQVKILGLVFNAVHPKSSEYYYYRHKEYYPQLPEKSEK